jgi:hypothetical protein
MCLTKVSIRIKGSSLMRPLAQARANLQQIAQTHGTNSDEYKKAERALKAYGAEGVKNGVTIFAKAGLGGGDTQVEGVAGKKTADIQQGRISA